MIFLHGLGADYHDFDFLAEFLADNTAFDWEVLLPNAPMRPISINNGYVMRGWYDIYSMDLTDKDDRASIEQSVQQVRELIDLLQQQGFDSEDIFLGGFSQGGVIALSLALAYPKKLAGILALSTYLPFSTILRDNSVKNAVFMAHGEQDPVIAIEHARKTLDILNRNGQKTSWHSYSMEHSVCDKELAAMLVWIRQNL